MFEEGYEPGIDIKLNILFIPGKDDRLKESFHEALAVFDHNVIIPPDNRKDAEVWNWEPGYSQFDVAIVAGAFNVPQFKKWIETVRSFSGKRWIALLVDADPFVVLEDLRKQEIVVDGIIPVSPFIDKLRYFICMVIEEKRKERDAKLNGI